MKTYRKNNQYRLWAERSSDGSKVMLRFKNEQEARRYAAQRSNAKGYLFYPVGSKVPTARRRVVRRRVMRPRGFLPFGGL